MRCGLEGGSSGSRRVHTRLSSSSAPRSAVQGRAYVCEADGASHAVSDRGRTRWGKKPFDGDASEDSFTLIHLARAFAVVAESVVLVRTKAAAVCGYRFDIAAEDGMYVAVGMRSRNNIVYVELLLPLPEDAHAGPAHTIAIISDSTVREFPRLAAHRLRQKGLWLQYFKAHGGATEARVASMLREAPLCDYALVFPNGNRLVQQERACRPTWLREVARDLGSAAKTVAEKVSVFVGDACLTRVEPNKLSVWETLVPMYQNDLREEGFSVSSAVPGLALQEDGMHWRISSWHAVGDLLCAMADRAVDVNELRFPVPPAWLWAYDARDGMHYPTCAKCRGKDGRRKRATTDHFQSKLHLQTHKACLAAPADVLHAGRKFLTVEHVPMTRDVSPDAEDLASVSHPRAAYVASSVSEHSETRQVIQKCGSWKWVYCGTSGRHYPILRALWKVFIRSTSWKRYAQETARRVRLAAVHRFYVCRTFLQQSRRRIARRGHLRCDNRQHGDDIRRRP